MATRVESRLSELEKQQALHEASLKAWQEAHEERTEFQLEAFASRLQSVEGAQTAMNETMTGVKAGLDTIISKMDKDTAVREALSGDRRKRKLDLKDWVVILSGFVVGIGALLPAIKAFFD